MNDASTAFIALGSNLGNREGNIRKALEMLSEDPRVRLLNVSSFYHTAPVGFTEQPEFVNAAAEIETTLSPRKLLELCLDTEKKLGRVRTIRWGPRVIDIDVLLFDKVEINEEDLQVPHPRMLEREFVIRPLADIAPDLVLSNGKTTVETLRELSR